VLRGEDLSGEMAGEIPLRPQNWEPAYPTAEFHRDRVDAPSPSLPLLSEARLTVGHQIEDPESTTALMSLVTAWTDESNGKVAVSSVEGDAEGAIGALGPTRALLAPLRGAEALALMGWTAASGGAHGRRRGAAAGRFGAWWTLAALAGLDWPPEPDELGRELERLQWFAWSDLSPPTGWTFHLAVEYPDDGLAWAIAAVDAD
jgi:hypothetical protein